MNVAKTPSTVTSCSVWLQNMHAMKSKCSAFLFLLVFEVQWPFTFPSNVHVKKSTVQLFFLSSWKYLMSFRPHCREMWHALCIDNIVGFQATLLLSHTSALVQTIYLGHISMDLKEASLGLFSIFLIFFFICINQLRWHTANIGLIW